MMSIDTFSIKDMLKFVPDRPYLKAYFRAKLGYPLDLDNPKTYNEKLQWMKLHYHNPLLHKLVDKFEVREYVADLIGEDYLVPLVGVYDSVEEFLDADLPNEFVAKCTHDSQSTHICTDKSAFDFDSAAEGLGRALRRNWFWQSREWAYKEVHPRIIVEGYLREEGHLSPNDYKFYFFDGSCTLVQCDVDRFENKEEQLFAPDWTCLGTSCSSVAPENVISKPAAFDEMMRLSSVLAQDFPHVRVDWYCIDSRPYFGELTFYTGGGFDPFYGDARHPDALDCRLGESFKLPQVQGAAYE